MIEFDPKKHVLFRGTPGAGGDLGANRKALREAVAEAQAQGKSVYIPNGEYVLLQEGDGSPVIQLMDVALGGPDVVLSKP